MQVIYRLGSLEPETYITANGNAAFSEKTAGEFIFDANYDCIICSFEEAFFRIVNEKRKRLSASNEKKKWWKVLIGKRN